MSPTSLSPILKGEVTFTLQDDFPFTIYSADFSVNVTSQSDASYMKRMRVISIDDSAKTITCKFGGAVSSLYSVSIRHSEYGLIDTSALILEVSSETQSFSPQTGSIYGGTLITI